MSWNKIPRPNYTANWKKNTEKQIGKQLRTPSMISIFDQVKCRIPIYLHIFIQ